MKILHIDISNIQQFLLFQWFGITFKIFEIGRCCKFSFTLNFINKFTPFGTQTHLHFPANDLQCLQWWHLVIIPLLIINCSSSTVCFSNYYYLFCYEKNKYDKVKICEYYAAKIYAKYLITSLNKILCIFQKIERRKFK